VIGPGFRTGSVHVADLKNEVKQAGLYVSNEVVCAFFVQVDAGVLYFHQAVEEE
jgi:hypothetical protein